MLNFLNFANRFKVVVPHYDAPFFENELKKKGIAFQVEKSVKGRNADYIYSVDAQHRELVEFSLKNNGIHHNLDTFSLFVNVEEKKIVGLYVKFVAVFAFLMIVLKLIKTYNIV